MYCIKCGTNNSDAANFCRKCGELMEPEDETHVAVRKIAAVADAPAEYRPEAERRDRTRLTVNEDETDPPIFSIGPTLMFVKIGYVFAAAGALLLVGILGMFGFSWLISIFLGLLLFLIPAYYHLRAKLVRYSLTDTQIEVDSGLIGRTTRNIPLRRIQDVTVATSATQRLLGFGDLVIDNASEMGGKVVLKNINSPKQHADLMLKQMRRLEGSQAASDARRGIL